MSVIDTTLEHRALLLKQHLQFMGLMFTVQASVTKANHLSLGDLADLGWAVKKCAGLLDEMRKEANAKAELIARVIAIKTSASVGIGDEVGTVRGKIAMAIPDIKMVAVIPKPGTPEYQQLLRYFNVPQEVIDSGMLKISYDQACAMLKALLEEGKNPPKGLVASKVDAMVRFSALKTTKERDETDGEEE